MPSAKISPNWGKEYIVTGGDVVKLKAALDSIQIEWVKVKDTDDALKVVQDVLNRAEPIDQIFVYDHNYAGWMKLGANTMTVEEFRTQLLNMKGKTKPELCTCAFEAEEVGMGKFTLDRSLRGQGMSASFPKSPGGYRTIWPPVMYIHEDPHKENP